MVGGAQGQALTWVHISIDKNSKKIDQNVCYFHKIQWRSISIPGTLIKSSSFYSFPVNWKKTGIPI